MSVLPLLIIISLSVALIFLASFYWSYKSGQYEDTETPSIRMLFDSGECTSKKKSQTNKTTT
ncbi:MAG TPA: cbb3-type cytochrome oxidase assembly protein CcoS [Bacteroidia bacterium]|nr:cbb3-type cytochrome oxidase assembly protein CcoS [Bacteroidia bacterium]